MEETILAVTEHRGGYAFRGDFLDCGLSDREIRHAVRSGLLVRLRHGTYAPAALVGGLTPERRHLLVAHSILDKLGDGVALSHHSAAMAHVGTSYGLNLNTIHVTRLDGRGGRTEAGVAFHVGSVVKDEDLCLVDGRLVVAASRAVVESCSLASVESGMVTASFAIREGVCTLDDLRERVGRHERWPGMLNVRLGIASAEPRCESVGEVRSMYMFARTGIPRPEPQLVIMRRGIEIARTDFGWIEVHHVGEFDGLIKYGRLNPYSGSDLGRIIVDEKRREDQIRDESWGVSRWTWHDLDVRNRATTAERIRTALERSRRVYGRNAVNIDLAR